MTLAQLRKALIKEKQALDAKCICAKVKLQIEPGCKQAKQCLREVKLRECALSETKIKHRID